jgi:hypothetical protein
MCKLRHASIVTEERCRDARWLQVPFIGVDKLLGEFKDELDKSAVVSIDIITLKGLGFTTVVGISGLS